MLVEGSLIAPAGQIRVIGSGSPAAYTTPIDLVPVREFDGVAYLRGESTWVAATARLLAAGVAQEVVTAIGQVAGVARPGGTVTLAEGRGALVVEAGAIIDVSGISGRTDTLLSGGGVNTARRGSIALASNAGGINLTGARGLFLDGTLLAHPGDTGAMGGTLTINSPSPQPFLDGVSQIGSVPNGISGRLGIIVTADAVTLPKGASRTDGVDPSLTRLANGSWKGDHLDRVRLSVSRLEGSGIDRLTLFGGGLGVTFLGDVALDVPRMIQIEGSRVTAAPGTIAAGALATAGAVANARISSAYVVLNGQIGGNAAALAGGKLAGALSISANALDLIGGVTLDGADKVTLASSGDIRLIGSQYLTTEYGQVQGALRSGGDLTLRAAQVYPAAGTAFTITAAGRDITIARAGGDIPRAPLSAAGSVTLEAATIAQGGVLRAPQGEIRLRPTSDLVFLPGSLTSVSADGRTVPLGQIDGFTYQASLLATNPQQPNGLTSAPQKLLDIAGPRIRVEPGALLDASGGGDLLAYTFISGPGGSRDVLARADYTITNGTVGATNHRFADQRDVFAILPDLGSAIAPYSPYILDSGTSLGRGEVTAQAPATGVNRYGQQVSGSLPWVGDRITITQDSPVLPAGSYTLLPGRYAMLPGALRVTFGPAATVPTVVPLTASPRVNLDGSWQVQGVRGIAGTNVQDVVPRSIRLETTPVWSQYSSLTFDTANAFFPARAARLDQQVGRLPIDAGRLSLSASETLTLGGTIRFNHADAGRGGQLDIASSIIAITPNGVASTVPGALVLSDVALSAIGAETLTIGGIRQNLDGKDIVFPSARSVTVATGARLTGPDVVLVARAPARAGRRRRGERLHHPGPGGPQGRGRALLDHADGHDRKLGDYRGLLRHSHPEPADHRIRRLPRELAGHARRRTPQSRRRPDLAGQQGHHAADQPHGDRRSRRADVARRWQSGAAEFGERRFRQCGGQRAALGHRFMVVPPGRWRGLLQRKSTGDHGRQPARRPNRQHPDRPAMVLRSGQPSYEPDHAAGVRSYRHGLDRHSRRARCAVARPRRGHLHSRPSDCQSDHRHRADRRRRGRHGPVHPASAPHLQRLSVAVSVPQRVRAGTDAAKCRLCRSLHRGRWQPAARSRARHHAGAHRSRRQQRGPDAQ